MSFDYAGVDFVFISFVLCLTVVGTFGFVVVMTLVFGFCG